MLCLFILHVTYLSFCASFALFDSLNLSFASCVVALCVVFVVVFVVALSCGVF